MPRDDKALKSVFVNCPFDEAYVPLLRPLLYTIVEVGFTPRLASERSDSSEIRLDKICSMIEASSFSIHDLSRLKSETANEFYRMNMPFELGIDWGLCRFGGEAHGDKKFLILETKPHDFKIALSDLSGIDIKSHDDRPKEVVRAVRDWFYETVDLVDVPPPMVIWSHFIDFTETLFEDRKTSGLTEAEVAEDIDRMPVAEYLDLARRFTKSRRSQS